MTVTLISTGNYYQLLTIYKLQLSILHSIVVMSNYRLTTIN